MSKPKKLSKRAGVFQMTDNDDAAVQALTPEPTIGQIILTVEQRNVLRLSIARILAAGLSIEIHREEPPVLRPETPTVEAVMDLVGLSPVETLQLYHCPNPQERIDAGFLRLRHNTKNISVVTDCGGRAVPLIYTDEQGDGSEQLH